MTGLVDRAMDAQIDLYRLSQQDVYLAHVMAYISNTATQLGWRADRIEKDATGVVDSIRLATGLGECYGVSSDIAAMLLEAAPSIPLDDWILEANDVPSPDGFIWLDGGLPIVDNSGDIEVAVAITWASGTRLDHELGDPGHSGVALSLLTTPHDPRDNWHDRLNAKPGDPGYECLRFAFSAAGRWVYGERIPEESDQPGAEWAKFVAALWRFMKEPYVEHSEQLPSRPTLKRQRRSGVSKPKVNVIRLRKRPTTKSEPGDGEAHYSHRFPVKGHWRNQWYASRGVHRPRWIPSYIKGPEDAPLRIHDRAFVVDR